MSKRILYIEDNPENRLLMHRVLTAAGYVMEEAVDGNSGLQTATESPPDLILIDINLPEIDGYEVASRLKQLPNLADVPIIAVTANVMKGDREKTLAAGCDGYIQKPIDIDLLPSQIESFLKKE
jgi:two-component system, cell cycle response regulator DivK